MEAAPPFQVVSGQRQLAAIMFTDAVGYSAQMNEQELATLNRLERDAAAMRRTADSHGGLVLKSTGDGLLIQFSSAVEAVATALEIQRYFHSRTEAGVSTSTLRHRIGIHLGDVFVGNGDAMGDGVNIAARLVTEAPPGGIAISQMVHDVVKNKMPLHLVRLGPRRLKNIKEPVTVYRVLLEEAAAPTPVAAAVTSSASPAPAAARRTGSRTPRLVLTLLLVLAVAGAAHYLLQQHLAHEEELGQSQSDQAALGKLLKKSGGTETAAPAAPAESHDFAALTSRVPAGLKPTDETLATVQAAERSQEALLAWLPGALARYTKDRPLPVASLGDAGFAGATVFTDANQFLYFAEGGAFRRRSWAELKEPVQAAIIVSALRNASPAANREVWRGAAAFAYLHGRTEMVPALQR